MEGGREGRKMKETVVDEALSAKVTIGTFV